MENREEGEAETRPIQHSVLKWRVRLIDDIKRKMHKDNTDKTEESASEKATRATANATKWIAVFTFFLAAAAVYQFIILSGQLDIMRKDQRAWMSVTRAGFTFEVGKPIIIDVLIRNTGKTPAKKINGGFRLEVLNVTDEPTFNYADKHLPRFQAQTVLPDTPPQQMGLTSLIPVQGTETVQPLVLTQELADKFNQRQVWIVAEGTISYDDIFRIRHWINVCRFEWKPTVEAINSTPPAARKCAEYNDTDDH